MTQAELFEVAGYFANPSRNTRIEIEARQKDIDSYAPNYLTRTGLHLPTGSDAVTILADDANKWARQMRLYFTCANVTAVPTVVSDMITIGGRLGYDKWNKRLNSKDIIDELFKYKFVIGDPQDETAIRSIIPTAYATDFDRGYNLP